MAEKMPHPSLLSPKGLLHPNETHEQAVPAINPSLPGVLTIWELNN